MKKKYSIDSFFAGTGGIDLGFAQTGKFKTIYANEIDPYARKTFHLNFPKSKLDGTDINKVDPNSIPNADVMVGGFPCQSFSIAGYRKGFKDPRGVLFFAMLKMIIAHHPRAVLCENVKNLVTHDHGNTFKVIREALAENGYRLKWHVLNTKDYGNVPQNRERIYIVGFRNIQAYQRFKFPKPIKLTRTIHDIIDFKSTMPEKYYYRQGKQKYYPKLKKAITSHNTLYQWRRKYVRANQSGVVPTMTANMGTGGSNVPLLLNDSNEIRKMTPRETFNAQGYPTSFKLPNEANGRLYKQAGNAVSVPVIRRIASNMGNALSYDSKAGKSMCSK